MNSDNATPNTFAADMFLADDQFAVPPQHDRVFTITDRTVRGNLIEFRATLSSEGSEQTVGECTLTFFEDFALSARRRVRTYEMKCMLCPTIVETETDTAYFTPNAVVCGKH